MQTLIKVKQRLAPTIGLLHHIALRCIFDNASIEEHRVLEDGLKTWRKVIDCPPDILWEIERIENALLADDKGFFDRAKELFKQHKIDYMQFYKDGLPYINPNRKFWNKS